MAARPQLPPLIITGNNELMLSVKFVPRAHEISFGSRASEIPKGGREQPELQERKREAECETKHSPAVEIQNGAMDAKVDAPEGEAEEWIEVKASKSKKHVSKHAGVGQRSRLSVKPRRVGCTKQLVRTLKSNFT